MGNDEPEMLLLDGALASQNYPTQEAFAAQHHLCILIITRYLVCYYSGSITHCLYGLTMLRDYKMLMFYAA